MVQGRVGIASAYTHEPGGKDALYMVKTTEENASTMVKSTEDGITNARKKTEEPKISRENLKAGKDEDVSVLAGDSGVVLAGSEVKVEEELNMENAAEALDDFFDAFD
jgi:hypothetical protein